MRTSPKLRAVWVLTDRDGEVVELGGDDVWSVFKKRKDAESWRGELDAGSKSFGNEAHPHRIFKFVPAPRRDGAVSPAKLGHRDKG